MTESNNDQKPTIIYQKPSKLGLIFPWFLLLLIITSALWAFTNGTMTFSSKPNNKTLPTTSEWQPPKSEPVPKQTLDKTNNSPVSSYHDAVMTASQSVVNIYTTQKVVENPYDFYELHGFRQRDSESTNLGSGVIVSADGYIVTNAHVIAKADNIVVMLNDGKKINAKLIGSDPESDLAVIKIDMTGLKPLGFKQDLTKVGDVVLAIGNPFGVGQTVTQGIISATGRTGLGINTFEDFIQTDAAINPGNSGGALVDAYGQLVGINTAIFSRSGGSMGIGFAIPTSIVEQVMNSIIKDGKVRRGWLGLELQGIAKDPTKINEEVAGVMVMNVLQDAPADQAGLQRGDIILAIDGQVVNDANSLIQLISKKTPASVVALTIQRGEKQQIINVTLGERETQNTSRQRQSQSQQQIPQELLDLFNQR